jgi:hypothetical protein
LLDSATLLALGIIDLGSMRKLRYMDFLGEILRRILRISWRNFLGSLKRENGKWVVMKMLFLKEGILY